MITPAINLTKKRPSFEGNQLEAICRILGDTYDGLTGPEIGKLLSDSKIKDGDPGLTKWKRLYNAFVHWQNKHQCSNNILDFIRRAMDPIRYINDEELFQQRRHNLNKTLSFIGFEISNTGGIRSVEKSSTISEAESKANHFKYKLANRNVHKEVLRFCNSELLVNNYFHSVFEAIKSIASRLRNMTGLYADGNELVETAFSTSNPLIRINLLTNATEKSEHIGLMNLIKGLFGLIRNPTAHTPKIEFEINEDEALDIMTTVSLIHKRLDRAL